MHVGKQFTLSGYFTWTKREIGFLFFISFIPVVVYYFFHVALFTKLPPFVSTVMGTSVAFLIGFKNNAAYGRYNEGLELYTQLQSLSYWLSFQIKGLDDKSLQQHIINLHMAWLTALRYALRADRHWENLHDPGTYEFMTIAYVIPERATPIEEAINPYLSSTAIAAFLRNEKQPLYCLELQNDFLEMLLKNKRIPEHLYAQVHGLLQQLIEKQEKCLRLKNFPYPRNLHSINKYFLTVFLMSLPFSLLATLSHLDSVWLVVPLSMFIGWIFVCLDKVGQHTMNPFEGTVMDVPIAAISRKIEIAMKQTCGLSDIPEPIIPMSGFVLL